MEANPTVGTRPRNAPAEGKLDGKSPVACNRSTVTMPALRLPAVRAPDTPQFPTMVAPLDDREPVVT